MSTDTMLLQQIAEDISYIKQRMTKLELTMEELDMDFHELKPEYAEKIKRIEKEGTVSQEKFEEDFGLKI